MDTDKPRYTVGENLHLQDAFITLREEGDVVAVELTGIGKPALVNDMCQRVADLQPQVIAEWPGNTPEGCTIFANVESGNLEAYAPSNNPPGSDWVPIFGIEKTAGDGYALTEAHFTPTRESTLAGSGSNTP